MLFRPFPSLNYSLSPQGQLLISSQSSREGDRGGACKDCLLLADPARQRVWRDQNQLLPCFGTGLAGESCHAQGFDLGDFPVRHMKVAPQRFSLLQCKFCLQMHLLEHVLWNCSAGTGCFHINRLGVAGEVSHNKHIEGKNSEEWQVSKILLPFPGTSVSRTLLSSSIMGQNVLIFGWGRVKTKHPYAITPCHWQLGHMEP